MSYEFRGRAKHTLVKALPVLTSAEPAEVDLGYSKSLDDCKAVGRGP